MGWNLAWRRGTSKRTLRQQPTTGNSKMAAQTGSSYISGTMIDSAEIPTTNLRFSTVVSSTKVPPDDSDSDQQPEVAIWLPRPDILITYSDTVNISRSNTPIHWHRITVIFTLFLFVGTFVTVTNEQKCRFHICLDCIDACTAAMRNWKQYCNTVPYSVVVVIIWEHFLELVIVEILTLSIAVPEIEVLPVWAAILRKVDFKYGTKKSRISLIAESVKIQNFQCYSYS